MDDILMQALAEGTEQSTDEVLMSAINEADEYDDILMHYGVDGMHWYERRYQNPDGSLTPLGRIHYGIGKARAKRAEKKIRKAEKAEADRVKKVERLARSGDVDKIYKNRELFTRTELEDAIERAEKIKNLKASKNKTLKEQSQKPKVTPEKAKESKITIDKLVNTAKTAVGAYAAYNALASAVNMSTGEHTLPQLDIESLRAWKMRKGTPLEDPAGKFYTNVSREDYEKGNANFTRTKLGKGDEKQKSDGGDGGGGSQQQNPQKQQKKQKQQKQQKQQNPKEQWVPQTEELILKRLANADRPFTADSGYTYHTKSGLRINEKSPYYSEITEVGTLPPGAASIKWKLSYYDSRGVKNTLRPNARSDDLAALSGILSSFGGSTDRAKTASDLGSSMATTKMSDLEDLFKFEEPDVMRYHRGT